MLKEFMAGLDTDVIGKGLALEDNRVDNIRLIQVNDAIRNVITSYSIHYTKLYEAPWILPAATLSTSMPVYQAWYWPWS